jgi:hypothetical protein
MIKFVHVNRRRLITQGALSVSSTVSDHAGNNIRLCSAFLGAVEHVIVAISNLNPLTFV